MTENIELTEAVEAITRSMQSHIETLILYRDGGCEPGSCTRAILENDLFKAIPRADPCTRQLIGDILVWIVRNLPHGAYGSREKVDAWMSAKRQEERDRHRG
jgi:hypothetical protein